MWEENLETTSQQHHRAGPAPPATAATSASNAPSNPNNPFARPPTAASLYDPDDDDEDDAKAKASKRSRWN